VKVFISSVRQGLEQERDALPGLVQALGHEPLRFEDFTAQSVPSREACLRGVADSDVYLLLLGPHYGTVFPETGLSPTHEEYTTALTKGIPRLVFRKDSVEFDEQQREFITQIEEYGTGVFRESFSDAVDLQPKVAAALRNLPTGPLTWHPLPNPPPVTWRSEWDGVTPSYIDRAEICVHAMPTETEHLSRRQLSELPEKMAGHLRALGLVPTSAAIETSFDASSALATIPQMETTGWREADHGAPLGCRIDASGQRSSWERLPSDSMGSVLDRDDLTDRIARSLRLMGVLAPLHSPQYAVAAELEATPMTTVGTTARLGQRNSLTGMGPPDRNIRVEPDESVGHAAFDAGAEEIAEVLSRHIVESFAQHT